MLGVRNFLHYVKPSLKQELTVVLGNFVGIVQNAKFIIYKLQKMLFVTAFCLKVAG